MGNYEFFKTKNATNIEHNTKKKIYLKQIKLFYNEKDTLK